MNKISEYPFFSVVIPTYERAEDLKNCLSALSYANQTGAPLYEVIVSDDSTSKDSKNLVANEFKDVIWNKGKKKGPAANRNAGVAIAKENGSCLLMMIVLHKKVT